MKLDGLATKIHNQSRVIQYLRTRIIPKDAIKGIDDKTGEAFETAVEAAEHSLLAQLLAVQPPRALAL